MELLASQRQLMAIMFTDIVGYTALMQEDEAQAVRLRKQHRRIFKQSHEQYRGNILQYFGDGTLSVFRSAVEAVACALKIQESCQNLPEIIPLRIGLHLGDIVFDGTEVYGDGVNLAARVESLCPRGAVLISDVLAQQLQNQPQFQVVSLGYFNLKNVQNPIEIFALNKPPLFLPKPQDLQSAKANPAYKSIAVLPFNNLSATTDYEYFSDGMTEEIINALSKIQELRVTSRTSSFYFKDKSLPLPEIAQALNVTTILEGSVRIVAKQMRLNVQLIDVSEDVPFWSESFSRNLEDIFAVQDEVSLLIADKLREQLGHLEIDEHLVEAPDIPLEAYQTYLKARHHLLKMHKPELEQGINLLENIIAQNPQYALAYLGMHLAYTLLGTIGLMPANEAFTKGQPYLEKALELDANLPECQLHLAWMRLLQDWDLARTYEHLQQSAAIRPTVDFYQTMTVALVAEKRLKAAHHYIDIALQIDPFSEITYHLKGFSFYVGRQFAQAIERFEQAIRLKPSFTASNLYLGQALIANGQAEEARKHFDSLPEDKGDILKLGGLTLAHTALGNKEESAAGIQAIESYLESDLLERALNWLILCEALRGEEAKVLRYLEQAIATRLPLIIYLPNEPLLKSLVAKPAFQSLMQQILPQNPEENLPEPRYKKSLINPSEIKAYKAQLEQLMQESKPYLDAGLTLRQLAEQMELPANHLSQLLNEGFGQNFSEFVNRYRVQAFKEKAANPDLQHLNLLGLAYESGFNSKTVFNTFFKKMTGKTPKSYFKEIWG